MAYDYLCEMFPPTFSQVMIMAAAFVVVACLVAFALLSTADTIFGINRYDTEAPKWYALVYVVSWLIGSAAGWLCCDWFLYTSRFNRMEEFPWVKERYGEVARIESDTVKGFKKDRERLVLEIIKSRK